MTQKKTRTNDLGALRNAMIKLRDEKRILAVQMSFEVDDAGDFFCFGNANTAYAHRHAIECTLEGDRLKWTPLPESEQTASPPW